MLKTWLTHPLTRGLDIDDPHTTHLRRRIIAEKPFLRRTYQEWYESLAATLPTGPGAVLELGSGAGFLRSYIPDLIASELFHCPDINAVLDGHALPFAAGSLRAIIMTNVLHHIAAPRRFFNEAARCVRPGGVVAILEPWVTSWSRLVYTRLHHEPFQPDAAGWEFPTSGPLSGANGALPWMLFARDRVQFEREFPCWRITTVQPLMPVRYLLSGGVSLRSLMPGWSFGLWRSFEQGLQPWMNDLAMFAQIVLVREER